MTLTEKLLWQKVRNGALHGLKFKRQHSIGSYITDFYCASLRLIIELDGGVHLDKEQKEKDKARDKNFRDMNYIVLRFTNDMVLNNIEHVLQEIEKLRYSK